MEGGSFDSNFVGSSADSEVTLLSPLVTPAVLDDPELGVCGFLNSISNNQDGMVCRVIGVEFEIWNEKEQVKDVWEQSFSSY